MSTSPSAALKVYRIGIAIVTASVLLFPIPYINIIGLMICLGGGLVALTGLLLFWSAAPSGIGLGERLGIVVALCCTGVFLMFQSLERWSMNTPLLITGALCMAAAGVVFHLFWMKVAEGYNAWRVAERFRAPMVVGLIGSLLTMAFAVVEVPVPVRLVINGTLGLVTFIMYWLALSELQNVLTFGASSD